MGNITLSISMLTPGGPYLEACLDSLHDLRTRISCELVIVDTGCDSESRALIEQYADRIVPFTWCDDFAAARNAGLEQCKGKWFLYLDDDEVFEDVDGLIRFLLSDDCCKYSFGQITRKNYFAHPNEPGQYDVNLLARLFRRTEGMRFVYPIHEGIPIKSGMQGRRLDVTLGHYGYIYKDREALLKHSERNIPMLLKALEEYPNASHLASQLAHEYQIIDDYEKQVVVCEKYYSNVECEAEDSAILACGWLAGLIGLGKYERAIDLCEKFELELSDCVTVLVTIYTYAMISFYHLERYQEMDANAQMYENLYQRAKEKDDSLAYEFFTKNGLDAGYRSLLLQMLLIVGLKTQDDDLITYYKGEIAWDEPGVKLYDDFPRVLCEAIEQNSYTAAGEEFLENVLQVDVVKNAVLQYKARLLRE